jgi:EpsI family protein
MAGVCCRLYFASCGGVDIFSHLVYTYETGEDNLMKFRREFFVSILLLVVSGFFLRSISHGEETSLRKSFADFPLHVDRWSGKELGFEAKVLQVLKVDDYMMRQYSNEQELPLSLYVGYYKSMRQGATYHSPKNCLPGSGWYFVKTGKIPLHTEYNNGEEVYINRFIIQKGLDKQLVLYWYQDRGRIITSEYWAKIYMVFDAITRHRTDGAFVRITVPFLQDEEERALAQGKLFAEKIFPILHEHLPS